VFPAGSFFNASRKREALQDPLHMIGNVRGAAVEVFVDRQSFEVENASCYQ
jgi:hypothetical protein